MLCVCVWGGGGGLECSENPITTYVAITCNICEKYKVQVSAFHSKKKKKQFFP
jgi:hypothetical protein